MISSPGDKKISSAQMRAARAMLRWSALDLARLSKVGVATIRRVEVIEGEIPVTAANEAAVHRRERRRPRGSATQASQEGSVNRT
jgi:hypothetical protein